MPIKKVKRAKGKRYSNPPKTMTRDYKLTEEKYLTESEQAQLEKNIEAMWDVHPRNSALISLGLNSGGRVNELLNLRKKDLLSKNQVHIRGLKNSNDRNIPLAKKLYDRLVKLSEGMSADDFLFPIEYTQARKIWCQYRPAQKKFHSLRHTFAYNVFKKSKNVFLVQKCLGHKDFNCSLVYMKFQYDEDEMMKVLVG